MYLVNKMGQDLRGLQICILHKAIGSIKLAFQAKTLPKPRRSEWLPPNIEMIPTDAEKISLTCVYNNSKSGCASEVDYYIYLPTVLGQLAPGS